MLAKAILTIVSENPSDRRPGIEKCGLSADMLPQSRCYSHDAFCSEMNRNSFIIFQTFPFEVA